LDALLKLAICIPVLVAAMILGNWFLAEFRRTRIAGKPWFAGYCTLPGILIVIFVILFPILLRIF
jgi:hypothetical protein